MVRIISKSFIKFFTAILCLSISFSSFAAKIMKEKDRMKLVNIVKQRYAETMMQGAEVIKIGGQNILVTVVGVKKNTNVQRVAQVKAARTVGEYLQSSANKSITIYEVTDNQSYYLDDNASETGYTHNSTTSSNIDQKTDDVSIIESSEKFTDRIVQTSFTQVNHIQPLCNLGMNNGEIVYAYYMIIDNK